jgi:SAM-dependent methyltransferase
MSFMATPTAMRSLNGLARPCPACEGERHTLLFKQRFDAMSGGSLLEGYDVVSCRDCGFCFASRIPEQEKFDWYYQEMSKYENAPQGGRQSAYDAQRLTTIAEQVAEWCPNRQARVLEIGCGTGGLLAILKQLGYQNVCGMDPSTACAGLAKALYDIVVTPGTLSALSPGLGQFDLVILAGVLEHVRDLDTGVAALTGLLTTNGRLFIGVPDASRYTHGEDAPYQEFSVEHINFFGPGSLSNLMAKHGFVNTGCRQELVEFSHRTVTPAFNALFEKRQVVDKVEPDLVTPRELAAYVEQCSLSHESICVTIDRLVLSDRPFVVWGTGAHTLRLLAVSRLSAGKIVAFVDSNPRYQGKRLHDAPIIAPSDLAALPAEYPILISSRVYQREIGRAIRESLHLPNEIVTLYDVG